MAGVASVAGCRAKRWLALGPGYKARRWPLLEAVERLWPRIEQIALAKIKAASAQPIGQAMTISIDELNDLPLAIPYLSRSFAGT
jgi:hypothetical protein